MIPSEQKPKSRRKRPLEELPTGAATERGGGDTPRSSISALVHRPVVTLLILLLLLVAIWAAGHKLTTALQLKVPTAAGRVEKEPVSASPAVDPGSSVDGAGSAISEVFGSSPSRSGNETWFRHVVVVSARLALAAFLAAVLAFRPNRKSPILRRNPYVAQTQILLSVIASALMMIVGDSAARAFGIFAAASLVRFRTNIRDPKEITVLLINLGIGLATGVGRWELAIILSVFVLILLWVLEHYEPMQVFRAMELKIRTRRVEATEEVIKQIFEKHDFSAEVRELNREDEDEPLGKIVYYVNLSPLVSIDELSEEIFSSDEHNIDSVEWEQKKSLSYIYR
jgi:uncharacterized protein DUF4956